MLRIATGIATVLVALFAIGGFVGLVDEIRGARRAGEIRLHAIILGCCILLMTLSLFLAPMWCAGEDGITLAIAFCRPNDPQPATRSRAASDPWPSRDFWIEVVLDEQVVMGRLDDYRRFDVPLKHARSASIQVVSQPAKEVLTEVDLPARPWNSVAYWHMRKRHELEDRKVVVPLSFLYLENQTSSSLEFLLDDVQLAVVPSRSCSLRCVRPGTRLLAARRVPTAQEVDRRLVHLEPESESGTAHIYDPSGTVCYVREHAHYSRFPISPHPRLSVPYSPYYDRHPSRSSASYEGEYFYRVQEPTGEWWAGPPPDFVESMQDEESRSALYRRRGTYVR